ncbi:MAG: chemotaxis protein CheW [Spirochaetaceae bacterium]|nr:chemotaxis protein CheW [Spirochaetaceae bacterium]MBO4727531.1 chemotaxis protein CheW [Spirochaetaceae bacterium]MBR4825216.1 chemotaxis protein CheW [Spirochaetaceae bacterium]
MAVGESQFQLVTFELGEELYGVDIMDVKEIVKLQTVRPIPNAPYYVEGIFNLRSEIIPVINLHKRFHLKARERTEDEDEFEGGFIIINMDGTKIGIIIDKIARVVQIKTDEVKPPPQMLTGIGTEYINGVVRQENGYLIILDIRRVFNSSELKKLVGIQ